ncbi:aspartyl/asparaginyl beta-hydroxylase domain-containing protein [Collimonas humicola]|uniref:aspartyl/asparaginyl beta-hydroxylase domain-containing protein n=1 Tax=Collimonas humicola TaxID=2825886 RepID=UPI001B8C8DBC|nr:aspartyl/asparaginyl beta-hydroxylase domain-containing protein [Collimonas humicola]
MNKFLKLPLLFDSDELLKDLQACETMDWPRHFHTDDYSGLWSGLALRSASGKADDIYSHPGGAGHVDTPVLGLCPYIASVLGLFECEIESARLLRLAPGAFIKEHRDVHTGYQFDVFRVHIPIETSTQVRFLVGGHALDMREGECWYADFSQPHSVENCGATARTNLILDCKRNSWSDALFRQAGYDFDEEARSRRLDSATRAMVIARLSEMKTDTAERLIRQLEAEAASDE